MMTGETLLYSIDSALDQAIADGRIRVKVTDPDTRALTRRLLAMGAPFHILPRKPQPPMTACLVMDRDTVMELARACRSSGTWFNGRTVEYAGVPIKVDEGAGGTVYVASLQEMGRGDE